MRPSSGSRPFWTRRGPDALQRLHDIVADTLGPFVRRQTQYATYGNWQMIGGMRRICAEDIMVEPAADCLAFAGRHVAHREQRVNQCRERRCSGLLAPPIIDEHIEPPA